MLDLDELKLKIIEKFFIQFASEKPIVKKFIIDYLYLVEIYYNMPHFIRFNRNVPVLNNLHPEKNSLVVVYFEKEDEVINTSVFPICFFKAFFKHKVLFCKDSINLLLLFLEISNVKYVGFYRIKNYNFIIQKIKQYNPQIKCYPSSSFHYFCKFNKIVVSQN